ncbi:hypothetical protein K474DRAFT_1663554 [Panus rudis PR-1116 ss-1]|nr:hypothetical protein K474DRAFT_1663554 [Panus rudis PR-1116 ss-1]
MYGLNLRCTTRLLLPIFEKIMTPAVLAECHPDAMMIRLDAKFLPRLAQMWPEAPQLTHLKYEIPIGKDYEYEFDAPKKLKTFVKRFIDYHKNCPCTELVLKFTFAPAGHYKWSNIFQYLGVKDVAGLAHKLVKGIPSLRTLDIQGEQDSTWVFQSNGWLGRVIDIPKVKGREIRVIERGQGTDIFDPQLRLRYSVWGPHWVRLNWSLFMPNASWHRTIRMVSRWSIPTMTSISPSWQYSWAPEHHEGPLVLGFMVMTVDISFVRM